MNSFLNTSQILGPGKGCKECGNPHGGYIFANSQFLSMGSMNLDEPMDKKGQLNKTMRSKTASCQDEPFCLAPAPSLQSKVLENVFVRVFLLNFERQ